MSTAAWIAESVTTATGRQGTFSDLFSDALRGIPCSVRGISTHDQPVPVDDWTRPVGDADRLLLGHCWGTTLDVGCGPGRMSAHLASQGRHVLGVDIVREAVGQTRARGVAAVRRNIFDPVPGEGSWDTVLLADGNIGIGGDPLALLRRAGELLHEDGEVVCDLAEPGTGIRTHTARLVSKSRWSSTFPWAQVGPDAIHELSDHAGFRVRRVDQRQGLWYAVLTQLGRGSSTVMSDSR